MKIPVRCYSSDHNVCEIVRNDICEDCSGCAEDNNYFEINEYDDFFTITYYQRINNIVIHICSERIKKDLTIW